MSVLLSASDAVKYRERLTELFSYCKFISTGEMPDKEFCSKKIDELIAYLIGDKAFLFAEIINGELQGFLWACRVLRGTEERFHTLYFAVGEEAQSQGIGSKLILSAEQKALDLGIGTCELNVNIHNRSAKRFYEKRGYILETTSDERETLIKPMATQRG